MSAPSVPLRQLGKNGPKIPAIGFGLMGLAGAYGTAPDDEERFKVLDRAYELGETFWDTAIAYGDNEEMIGKWFKRTGKRDEIFLASKFGIVMEGREFKAIDSSGEYCKKACAQSLEKLGVDCIDLYYAHRLHPNIPVEETMRALAELRAEGKIKHIGLCEVSSTALKRAVKIAPVAAVQVEYSPFVREIESEASQNLLATCRELGVALVCYSPLGRGLLTGNITSRASVTEDASDLRSKNFPWFAEENIAANATIVAHLKGFAEKKKKVSVGQLVLAWILAQGDDFFPIPGTRKIKYLEENWAAKDVALPAEEVAEIRRFVEENEVQGYRSYPQAKYFAYVDTKEEA